MYLVILCYIRLILWEMEISRTEPLVANFKTSAAGLRVQINNVLNNYLYVLMMMLLNSPRKVYCFFLFHLLSIKIIERRSTNLCVGFIRCYYAPCKCS